MGLLNLLLPGGDNKTGTAPAPGTSKRGQLKALTSEKIGYYCERTAPIMEGIFSELSQFMEERDTQIKIAAGNTHHKQFKQLVRCFAAMHVSSGMLVMFPDLCVEVIGISNPGMSVQDLDSARAMVLTTLSLFSNFQIHMEDEHIKTIMADEAVAGFTEKEREAFVLAAAKAAEVFYADIERLTTEQLKLQIGKVLGKRY